MSVGFCLYLFTIKVYSQKGIFRITIKIKPRYYLQLLTLEMTDLLGITKNQVTKAVCLIGNY